MKSRPEFERRRPAVGAALVTKAGANIGAAVSVIAGIVGVVHHRYPMANQQTGICQPIPGSGCGRSGNDTGVPNRGPYFDKTRDGNGRVLAHQQRVYE